MLNVTISAKNDTYFDYRLNVEGIQNVQTLQSYFIIHTPSVNLQYESEPVDGNIYHRSVNISPNELMTEGEYDFVISVTVNGYTVNADMGKVEIVDDITASVEYSDTKIKHSSDTNATDTDPVRPEPNVVKLPNSIENEPHVDDTNKQIDTVINNTVTDAIQQMISNVNKSSTPNEADLKVKQIVQELNEVKPNDSQPESLDEHESLGEVEVITSDVHKDEIVRDILSEQLQKSSSQSKSVNVASLFKKKNRTLH